MELYIELQKIENWSSYDVINETNTSIGDWIISLYFYKHTHSMKLLSSVNLLQLSFSCCSPVGLILLLFSMG